MTYPIIDLAALNDLPQEQINRDNTRVIIKANPTAVKLDYITIDQLTNVIIGNKLTLSAPCIVTPGSGNATAGTAYIGNNLAVSAPVSFTVPASWRPGFITGAQFLCTATTGNAIKCNTTDYDPETGLLTGTVIDAEGATATVNWTAAYLTSFFAASAVEFTPTPPFPANVTNVQSALDWVGNKFAVIVRTHEETVLGVPRTLFTIVGGYDPSGLQVYLNGLLLNRYDYTASNGTTVELMTPANVTDELKTISFHPLDLTEPLDADKLNGQPPSYYLNYSNMTGQLSSGTIIDCGTFP